MNNREMAKRMAAELFFGIRGDGEWERATRLQLKYRRPDGSEASGGGWCEAYVAYKLEAILDLVHPERKANP
jgi:hypothetical protein